jgi:hypothetical protein
VILTDDISRAAVAVSVGQRTLQVARQSIWAGIALSVVLMAIAALGVIPAIVGALCQEFVDVVAIANSLRAMRAGRREITDFRTLADRAPVLPATGGPPGRRDATGQAGRIARGRALRAPRER